MNRLPSIYPQEWNALIDTPNANMVMYRNLMHFKTRVSQITQKEDDNCGISYAKALEALIAGRGTFTDQEFMSIRNLVRSNLLKRGLLTAEVYEAYKYAVDGTTVDYDMGKYAAGEPDCVITPGVEYIDFFYELYVNISYRCGISNSDIALNMNKMLATIEELQRQHINIKITLVLPIGKPDLKNNFFSVIPLYSHKDFKTAQVMSSVLNEYLLRKFYFAILEDHYGEDLDESYGTELKLPKTMNLADEFNEVDFFTLIKSSVDEEFAHSQDGNMA